MSVVTSTRLRQTSLIEQNKASIVIARETSTSDGAGGYEISTANLASQDIRIYNKKARVLDIDTGGWSTKRETLGIAKYDANILPNTVTNKDTFTHGGKEYIVKDVVNQYCQENIVFKEVQLEEL